MLSYISEFINFCIRLIKISILYQFPVVSAGFFVRFSRRGDSSPTRVPHWLQVSVSGSRQTRPLFYPVRQLDHVCRVDAEEDEQDFRPLRPGLDPSEIVVLFLCPEWAFHRSRPPSGKFLSDKVFLNAAFNININIPWLAKRTKVSVLHWSIESSYALSFQYTCFESLINEEVL